MEASHYCMAWRGVKDMDSKMINSVMRGVFLKDPNLRREFLSLIPRSEKASHAGTPALRQPRGRHQRRSAIEAILTAVPPVTTPPAASPASLCYGGGIFLQAIEGGRMAVSDLFGHIQKDARHKDVVLLHYEEITERRFGGWTMGQVNLSKINHSILLKYSERPSWTPTPCRARCRWPCWKS
jgi:hypothetical protein